jgi:hypothetical protein
MTLAIHLVGLPKILLDNIEPMKVMDLPKRKTKIAQLIEPWPSWINL